MKRPTAVFAIFHAVGQRCQLIPEVLAMIQCLQMPRGEEFVSSLPSDKDDRAEQDEANWNSTDIQGVPISWKCRPWKSLLLNWMLPELQPKHWPCS